MPWRSGDAPSHTKKADTPKKQRQWVDVSNSALNRGESDGDAVRQANAVVAYNGKKGGSWIKKATSK